MSVAISARNVSKLFARQRQSHPLRGLIERAATGPLQRFPDGKASPVLPGEARWALQDVSFEIARGECVALIGHNGAGKSVLLRILSRVTRPTRGEAVLRGRVGAVLDAGVGFHRELTGRENIFLQGAILGLTHKELARRFDSIVELSGMRDFLQDPLKTYSSGMQVRLAFAVAAQLEPEILLMDEVLAVADEDFVRVCVDKLNELKRAGRTILLASHDLGMLSQLCARALCLERGRIVGDGPMAEIAERYHAHLNPPV
jgi:lipopolysaccharide transport system ATP-binding protein